MTCPDSLEHSRYISPPPGVERGSQDSRSTASSDFKRLIEPDSTREHPARPSLQTDLTSRASELMDETYQKSLDDCNVLKAGRELPISAEASDRETVSSVAADVGSCSIRSPTTHSSCTSDNTVQRFPSRSLATSIEGIGSHLSNDSMSDMVLDYEPRNDEEARSIIAGMDRANGACFHDLQFIVA